MKIWRLLDTHPMSAAENMALDEALVELRGQGRSPDTIHFLQFKPRAVLVGFHQAVSEEVRTGYCSEHGIEVNRRITGGGAIFFDESQLGWEVICDKAFFGVKIPHTGLFRTLCEPVVVALARLGVRAEFRPRNDIEVNGRKISGTGGTESGDAFLFQGTMLTDFDVDTMLRSLKIPIEKLKAKEVDSVKERVTCLKWELGYTPRLEEIKEAVAGGFEQVLGIRLEPGGLSSEEEELFHRKIEYYRSSEWIDQVHPRIGKRDVIQAAYKSEAGMVRFTFVVNPAAKRLQDAYITGDFLSFPTRSLFDMEAALRGARLDRNHIQKIITDFFDRGLIAIPGMDKNDFVKPVKQAFEKVAISALGIPLEHCNRISVTNGTFKSIIEKKPTVLLLPYCSKSPSCRLRYMKGCRACGECSIGDAWRLGKDRHMKTICIVSFEDLWAELMRMKQRGVEAYVGCCCEPFFIKHFDDFEQAGLPGILLDIDNNTCYDLDQAKEAYAGIFTSQTDLDLDLLGTVLDAVKNGG
jgi:lipoate---protein ligase